MRAKILLAIGTALLAVTTAPAGTAAAVPNAVATPAGVLAEPNSNRS